MPPWSRIGHIEDPDERDLDMALYFLDQSRQGITNGQVTIRNADRIRGIDIDTPYEFGLAQMVMENKLFDFEGAFYE